MKGAVGGAGGLNGNTDRDALNIPLWNDSLESTAGDPRRDVRSTSPGAGDSHAPVEESTNEDAPYGDGPTPIGREAFHGVAGDIVDKVEAETEADPAAILGTILTVFGAVAGNDKTFYQGSQQAANLYVGLVGDSSTSRKGTSFSLVRNIFDAADPGWETILVPGLGSGEGLVGHLQRLHDDHRALILETEFGRLLRVIGREGSTLSPTLRDAWDGVPVGRILARERSIVARHHVACLAHITRAELLDKLTHVDAANGFGNRFLWLFVRRRRLVPFPKPIGPLVEASVGPLRQAIEDARGPGELVFTADAAERWADFYRWEASRATLGLAGALTARREAQAARLALVYALLDRSRVVDAAHLRAALAVLDHADRSVRFIFGDSVGDPLADNIRGYLAEGEATRMDLRHHTGVHYAVRLDKALDLLIERGLITVTKGDPGKQGGRPPLVYRRTA